MDKEVSALDKPPTRPGPRRPWERRYEARIAQDGPTRRDAYALRYASYHAQGFIAENETGLFRDEYDDMSSVTTIVVYQDGTPVGSVRTCLLRRGSALRSPACATYPAEVASILAEGDPDERGLNCFEVNRMVRAPGSANDQGLVFMLLRLAGRFGQLADFQMTLSCVRANHVAFYRRMRYVDAGPLRVYPGLNCEMALLKLARADWEITRRESRLMNPEAGPPGLLDGLETGRTVLPALPVAPR